METVSQRAGERVGDEIWLSPDPLPVACFSFESGSEFRLRSSIEAVHLWYGDLREVSLDAGPLILSQDESERARRFKFERDRRRFRASRVVLRRLLASYLDTDPASVRFRYGPNGKPECPGISFNMAHTEDCAVVAVAKEAMVGVDVERLRFLSDADAIATMHFPREWQRIRVLPTSDRTNAFFACWTAKEAFVKALGYGLSFSLSAFEVSITHGAESPRLVWLHPGTETGAIWLFKAFKLGGGHIGTIALGRKCRPDQGHPHVASSQ